MAYRRKTYKKRFMKKRKFIKKRKVFRKKTGTAGYQGNINVSCEYRAPMYQRAIDDAVTLVFAWGSAAAGLFATWPALDIFSHTRSKEWALFRGVY